MAAMEPTTFFEHYRICTGEAGREVSRTGAAINYKAVDIRSHEAVRLQLIPKSTIEPEKLAQLKERAETAEKLDHLNIAKTLAVGIDRWRQTRHCGSDCKWCVRWGQLRISI